MKGTALVLTILGASLCVSARPAEARVYKVKVATLMPRGTAWMTYLNRFKYNVRRRTGGAVRFVFYAGGVAGDEKDAIRKMRMGQIHGAAVTSVGLGLILPAVRILELPLLFRSYKEFHFTRVKIQPTLDSMFEARGYKMLAWAAAGWVYMYSALRVQSMADVRRAKVWRWTDDPVVPVILKELGVRGIPLGVPDVLPSLQTGIINTAYGMPQSTLALQWHTKLKYVLDMRIDMAVAGIVIKKSVFDSLPAAHQKVVVEEAVKLEKALNASSRSVNRKSLKSMVQAGMVRIRTPVGLKRAFRQAARRVHIQMTGRLYSRQLYQKLQQLLKQCRSSACTI